MYDVSERTSRIGWVRNTLLGDAARGEPLDETWVRMLNVDVRAARDTFLTDDPFVSQFAQFSVPKGTTFQCMGMLGNDWAVCDLRRFRQRIRSRTAERSSGVLCPCAI